MIDYDIKEYDRYLDSEEWAWQRKKTIAEQGEQCQICCRIKSLQVHHCDYSNNPELVVLCDGCHQMISDMVIEFNETSWRDKLSDKWCSAFLTRWITNLYKKQYCREEAKPVNFLELRHLQRVIKICRHTLQGQCSEKDYVLRVATLSRIANATCQIEIQKAVSEYRRKFHADNYVEGWMPGYAADRYLGIRRR